jgi:hypothetical protein
MKTPTIASVLILPLLLAYANPASAMCAFARGPRLLEAQIISCEDPRSVAEQKLQRFSSVSGGEVTSPDSFLAANPGRILTLRVTRFQQLSEDPRGNPKTARQTWTKVKEPEKKQYVFLGAESCEQLAKEKVFLEQMDCCDTVPPAGLGCLLEMEAVVLPPTK